MLSQLASLSWCPTKNDWPPGKLLLHRGNRLWYMHIIVPSVDEWKPDKLRMHKHANGPCQQHILRLHIHAYPGENDWSPDKLRLYEFVVRSFLACCSLDAVGYETTVSVSVRRGDQSVGGSEYGGVSMRGRRRTGQGSRQSIRVPVTTWGLHSLLGCI